MNEAADVANNIPAFVLLSFWWAFLSVMDLLSTPGDNGKPEPATTKPWNDEAATAEDEPGFAEIRELDPAFGAMSFLVGARRAYETVLQAYALGDLNTLRLLLSAEVLEAFSDVCAGRRERHETLELTLVGVDSVEIAHVETTRNAIEITVRFRAQIVSAERSLDGGVIRGDPAAIASVADLWTFSRSIPVGRDSWLVVATEGG